MISSLACVIWPLACMQSAAYLKHLYSSKSSVLLHSCLLVFLLLLMLFSLIVINLSVMTVLVIVVNCIVCLFIVSCDFHSSHSLQVCPCCKNKVTVIVLYIIGDVMMFAFQPV